jgi:hypothetical protein
MISVGMSIVGTVGTAMTAVLVNAVQARKQPVRVLSGKQGRLSEEEVHDLELHLRSLLLKHRIGQAREIEAELGKANEALAYERYLNSRHS